MNTTTFPPKIYPQTQKATKTLSVSTGIAQLRSLADPSQVKAYILDHEAVALVLLALFLIAGTVFYVDFQPLLYEGTQQPQNSALLASAEAQIQQRLDYKLSPPIVEAASDMGSIAPSQAPAALDPADQPAGLISPAKSDNPLVHRKGIHHHHLRRHDRER
jgi:hypothetical protein